MRLGLFGRWRHTVLLITAVMGAPPVYPVEAPVTTTTAAGDECEALRHHLTAAERALTERGGALQARLDTIAAELGELEARHEPGSASEPAERKERLTGEQAALQDERKFVESAKTAWQAAIDACQGAARFREELEHFRAALEHKDVEFVSGDVAALQAQLDQVQNALAALEEPATIRAERLSEVEKLAGEADEKVKALLEAERAALQAETVSARHKRAAREAERALLEAKLAAAREMVGDVPATQPEAARPADAADALNKQRLAEQLEAKARDRLDFARSRLANIESSLEQAAARGLDVAPFENEREYWKRVEEYEQRRLQQAELDKRAARQTEATGRLNQRIEGMKKSLEELGRKRSAMTADEREERAAYYRDQAEAARKEAEAFDEQARAEEKKIGPLQQLLPSLDAIQRALDERLEKAKGASFTDYERLSRHVDRMREQLDVERQIIDLMVMTTKYLVYARMREATLTRELAGLYVQCADVLDPPVPSFWERQRKIIHSIGIVAVVIGLSYTVRLVIWLIRQLLMFLKGTPHRGRFSVKRIGTLLSFAGSIVRLFVWIFGVIAILNEFGIEPSKSTGALGLIGLIMAGMFQQIVVDFVKGLDIIAGRHYNVGDFVEVDGKFGHVVDFNVKHTRIRTVSGQEFNIPNSRCVPSRRFPDGYVDNYIDVILKTRADQERAKDAIDAVCPDINQRIEPVQGVPFLAERFFGPHGRTILRYRLRVLPGCAWVAKDHFIPALKEAVAQEGIELAAEPALFFINRIETFRKLFSRRLSEEEIVGEAAQTQTVALGEVDEPRPDAPAPVAARHLERPT